MKIGDKINKPRLVSILGQSWTDCSVIHPAGQLVGMLCFLVVVMAHADSCLMGMPFKNGLEGTWSTTTGAVSKRKECFVLFFKEKK